VEVDVGIGVVDNGMVGINVGATVGGEVVKVVKEIGDDGDTVVVVSSAALVVHDSDENHHLI